MSAKQVARVDGAGFQNDLGTVAQKGCAIGDHPCQRRGLDQRDDDDRRHQPAAGQGAGLAHDPPFPFRPSRVATQAPPSRISPAPR